MNIIWLTPEVPYPPIGGRNGVYNRIVQLSKYNIIHLFSIIYEESEKSAKDKLLSFCKNVNFYNRNKHKTKTFLKSFVLPFSVASRTIRAIKRDVKELLLKEKIDLVIVDFPNMVKNIYWLRNNNNIVLSLNQHNVEYKRMRDLKNVKHISFLKKIAYFLESLRLELYERRIYYKNGFDSITFFSNDDLDFFKKKWGHKCKADLKLFPLGANKSKSEANYNFKHNILFVGRLDNVAIPNVEAVLWFEREILPLIVKQIPDAKFIVAGANPSSEILSLTSKNIEIIPNYKKLEDVYKLSDLIVLPLLSGGGVKGKLLEAVSFHKAIVSTPHGVEGTKFKNGEHLFVSEDSEEFANNCVSILRDIKKHINIINAAYNLFLQEYDWEIIGLHYQEYLNDRVNKNE